MKLYIGIVEPTNRLVLWLYPLNNGGFEIRLWGALGWKSLSSGTNTEEMMHVGYTLTGFLSSNNITSVVKSGAYLTLLTLQNSYENPNILIYMGGVNITSTALTDNQNGTYTISIADVTGDIDITATATSSVVTYPITYSLTGYSTSSSNEVVKGQGFTIVLTPNNGYNPTPTSINMTIASLGQVITNGVSGQLGVTISTTDGVTTITCTSAVAVGNVSLNATAPQILNMSYSLASGYTLNNQPSTITAGSSFTATVTPPSGKTPTISVTMGGVDITETCVSGNTINIASVTGNVSVTVTEAQSAYTVSYSVAPVFTLSNNATSVNSGASYITTITPQSGAMLNAVVTMGGVDITNSCLSGNVITINSVTDNISITLTDVSATYADYAKAVYNVTDTANPTQLLYSAYTLSNIAAMRIDGTDVTPTLSYTFASTGMHTVYIKMTGDLANSSMFQGCSTLYSCTFPNVTKSYNTAMFTGCSSLHDVDLKCSLAITLPSYMFDGCTALTTVKFGANVSGISQYTFSTTSTLLSTLYVYNPTTFNCAQADTITRAGTIHYVAGADISTLTAKFPNFTLVADL